jgi:methoxymalonate biosynthesis protein
LSALKTGENHSTPNRRNERLQNQAGEMSAAQIQNPKSKIVKCLIWDLDDTLWQGVQAEGAAPAPRPAVLAIMDELARRGIVQSVASRNDPAIGARLLAQPALVGRFVAPQVGWEPKDAALRKIARELNIGLDSLAFVDDSPFERAAVAAVLPEVLVLAPHDLPTLLDRPELAGGPGTAEAAARPRLYQEEAARREAEHDFAGDRRRFLESCAMVLTVRPATAAELPRLDEMVARTNQLNSTGYRYPPAETARRVADPVRYLVPVAWLRDRFGDYGLIGAAFVDRQAAPGAWLVELLMLSCRVEGRGIPGALVRMLLDRTAAAGVPALDALYRANPQNRQMAVLLRSLGFRAGGVPLPNSPGATGAAAYRRTTAPPLPPYPTWLTLDVGGFALEGQ